MKKRTQSDIHRKELSQEYYLIPFNKKDQDNIEALEKARLMFDVRVTTPLSAVGVKSGVMVPNITAWISNA